MPTAPACRLLCSNRPFARFLPFFIALVVVTFLFYSIPSYHHHSLSPQSHPPRPYPPPSKPNVKLPAWETRAQRVAAAFKHAWTGYQEHAAGWDELTPVDGGRVNNFNGWGVTLFDALDTMWLIGLRNEFRDALQFAASANFTLTEDKYAPFFETIIRYLGGLLSAYALSGEPVLLTRADDLGRMLLPAFNTPSGLPRYAVNTVNGKTKIGWTTNALWSEALSNQLEYKFLAHLTGRAEYFIRTEKIMKLMYKAKITTGLFPTMWSVESGTPNNAHYSVGAYADSAHEYLLKQYLLTARSEPQTLELYLNSINGTINNLLYITPTRHLLYVTDISNGSPTHTFQHLSCFYPGLLALGIYTLSTSPDTDSSLYTSNEKQLHQWAAEGLAETCWLMYYDQQSGLGPDEVMMKHYGKSNEHHDISGHGGDKEKARDGLWVRHIEKWMKDGKLGGAPPGVPLLGQSFEREENPNNRDYTSAKDEYLLRPETVETFFYMWKLTGDSKWRERAWLVFEAIEKHTKTTYGFASISGVDRPKPDFKNEMPSFFLAETLKYLYLLFKEDDLVPLKDWVFNTEAHPLPVFDWSPWEKQEYNITV